MRVCMCSPTIQQQSDMSFRRLMMESAVLYSTVFIALSVLIPLCTGVCCQAWSPDAECCDDLCVAHRSIDSVSNQPRTLYYCLNKNSNPHWRESCNGLQDTNVTVVQCCIEENCNSQLFPRLPSEPTVPTTYPPYRPTITPSTTSEPTAIASTNTPTTAMSTDVPNGTNEGTADSSTRTIESTTYDSSTPETSSEETAALTCSCSPPTLFDNCVNGQCNATKTEMFGCRISVQYFQTEDIHRVYYFCAKNEIDYLSNCGGGLAGDVFYRHFGTNGDMEICCVNGSDCNTRQLYEHLQASTQTTTEISTVETTMTTTADDVTTELSSVETTMATITDNGSTTILAGTDTSSASSLHACPILSTLYIAVGFCMLKVF